MGCRFIFPKSDFDPSNSIGSRNLSVLTSILIGLIAVNLISRAHYGHYDCKCRNAEFVDVKKPCALQVGVRDKGLGGALLRDGYPMAFTSSTLSAPERSMLLSKKSVWPSK